MYKKNSVICIFIIFLFSVSAAQDDTRLHDLLTKDSPSWCYDYAYNCIKLIPQLYDRSQMDSVHLILDFWKEKCGDNENIVRTKMLLALEDGTFDENLYDSTIINHMLWYRYKIKNYLKFGFSRDEEVYDDFTLDLAKRMKNKYDSLSLEYLIASFYANDFDYFFNSLKEGKHYSSDLYTYYHSYIRHVEKSSVGRERHYGGILRLWMPVGSNKVLGNHPAVGMSVGFKYTNIQFDFTMTLRFLKSKEPYAVKNGDVLDTTDYFFGAYIGGDGSYILLDHKKHRFSLTAGVGWDGLHTVEETDEKRKVLNSFNLNTGFKYQLFINKYHSWYIGFHGRYNFVNYKTDGGTDLSGNVITLSLLFGYSADKSKINVLKYLGHYD